ncbi:hypothetical protein GGH19_001098 [Coemansia sp. RSA 1807]|nr:hypothetical protein J3F80_002259 [Coemansia sp. RSA 2526]KAJ2577679.1 hypothetical protein GGH19_001098 [Coemansia sp. RSA 1807]
MVRRAVARHIICQVRRRQAAKHRRLLGRRALSVCDAGIVACSSDSDSSYAATEPELATTAAAISALATAMAAARTDPRADVDDKLSVPLNAGSNAELALIQRIFALQQEKEHLLRIMQQTS